VENFYTRYCVPQEDGIWSRGSSSCPEWALPAKKALRGARKGERPHGKLSREPPACLRPLQPRGHGRARRWGATLQQQAAAGRGLQALRRTAQRVRPARARRASVSAGATSISASSAFLAICSARR